MPSRPKASCICDGSGTFFPEPRCRPLSQALARAYSRQAPGRLGWFPIHRSYVVKDFLSSGAATRILLERLPSYAPDLNPDEGVWNYLKRVELKNVCCRDLPHLREELRKATKRLQHKPRIIRGCINQTDLIRC